MPKQVWEVKGLEDLHKQFHHLVKALDKDQVEPVLEAGANEMAEEIRSRIKEGPTGNLKKSVTTKRLTPLGKNPAAYIAAIDRMQAPHAHLVEWGTKERRHKNTGKSVGRVKARPFFRPAWDAKQDKVAGDILEKLTALVEGVAKE